MVTVSMTNQTADSAPAEPFTAVQAARALAAVPVTEDVIEYTIRCALALSPPDMRAELRAYIALHTSQQARRIFGGDRMYISRRSREGTSQRNAQIKRDYLAGDLIPLLMSRYGLCSRQIWYIVKS
jgi:hypothetical protein